LVTDIIQSRVVTEPKLRCPDEIPVDKEIEVESVNEQSIQENASGMKTIERSIESGCSVNNSTVGNNDLVEEIHDDLGGDESDIEYETAAHELSVRKRNKKADPSIWNRNKQKKLRMKGMACKGLSKSGGKYEFSIEREERVMKERTCKDKCKKCWNISEDERRRTFEQFWSNMDWNQKKVYVLSLFCRAVPIYQYIDTYRYLSLYRVSIYKPRYTK
jgi:hypothetical protein